MSVKNYEEIYSSLRGGPGIVGGLEWAGLNKRAAVRVSGRGLLGKALSEGKTRMRSGKKPRAVCGKRILGSGNDRDRGPRGLAPSGQRRCGLADCGGYSLLTFISYVLCAVGIA